MRTHSDTKRLIVGGLVVAVAVLLAGTYIGKSDDTVKAFDRDTPVDRDGKMDGTRHKKVAADLVEALPATTTRMTNTFKPPGAREFTTISGSITNKDRYVYLPDYVDVHDKDAYKILPDPEGEISITVRADFPKPVTAGSYPMKCEGNFESATRPPSKGKGGTLKEYDIWRAHVTTVLDIDVDSDNNNGYDPPKRTTEEDELEEHTGKYVPLNSGDLDKDGVPGFADGFNFDGTDKTVDDNDKKASFVPLVVVLPSNVDISKAKLKISYSASDPMKVSRTTEEPYIYTPAAGSMRIWKKNGNEARKGGKAGAADAKKRGDYVAPGTYSNISLLGFSGSEIVKTFYIEGIDPSSDTGYDEIKFELDPGNGKWQTDTVRVTVFGPTIVAASDYMVPGSENNVVRYTWKPEGITISELGVRVRDKDGNTKYEFKNPSTTHETGEDYAEERWDAHDKYEKPLTEAASDYTVDIGLEVAGMTAYDSLGQRKVKEWHLTVTVPDKEAFTGATVAGIDPSTVTTTDDKFVVTRKFVDESDNDKKIAAYGLTEDGGNVDALLKSGAGAKDYFLFYTTPTKPTDVTIKYQLDLDVGEGGCLDRAGNPWDMKEDTKETGNKWENHGEWTFFIDKDGKMTGFKEAYEEK